MGSAKRPTTAMLFFICAACGGGAAGGPPVAPEPAAPPASTSTTTPAPASAPSADPWQLPPRMAAAAPAAAEIWEELPAGVLQKAMKTKGVAAAPAECAAFRARKAIPHRGDFDEAVAESAPAKRDGMLVDHESRAGIDKPLIRTVRADLAPIECADVLTDPFLAQRPTLADPFDHALLGLSLAAKLARTGKFPPSMGAASDKAKVKAFIQGPLKAWLVEQATAIEQLSVLGRDLVGYGRGVAAVEAGSADLRLVDTIRSGPVPKEWDAELRQVYEAALDEALEPRKTRGRDAALVGLAELAAAGIVHDTRVDRARALLSKLYGGRRIDALDALLLPPAPAEPGAELRSSYYRHFVSVRDAKSRPPMTARTRFELARTYWLRRDFVEAAWLAKEGKAPADRLVLALSLALASGPANAAAMMSAPSPAALNLSSTAALDALAAEGGELAGMAAFDAAYLRSLSPPEGPAAAAHLRDVAARFRKAETLLADPSHKTAARERAADAEAAAAAAERPPR